MAALRWVIRSDGKSGTVVDGEDLPMEAGDLLTTPSRTWHDLDAEAAYLFSVTDRTLLDPFGLYEEEAA